MTRIRFISFLAGVTALVLAALAVAGCGGSNASSPAPPRTADGKSATVGVANENLGRILVDSQGRTLYLFQRDSGTKSTCTGACATFWPPLRLKGTPAVGLPFAISGGQSLAHAPAHVLVVPESFWNR